MKRIKRTLCLLLCLVLCFQISSIKTEAADSMNGLIIDGSVLSNEKAAIGTSYGLLRGAYLSNGTVGISNEGNGTIGISGATYCYQKCSQVKCNVYVERLENGNWVSVTNRSVTENNTYTASISLYLNVKKGYYYRVRGGHAAIQNGKAETTTSTSSGIYIG